MLSFVVLLNIQTAQMDDVSALKRSSEINEGACIFFLKHLKDDYLRAAFDYNRTVVHDAMNLRTKFRGFGNRVTISRLEEVTTILILQLFGVSSAICYSEAETKFNAY